MNVKDYAAGNNVTVELVKQSSTKKLVILSEGTVKDNKIVFLVEIDNKRKDWTPNKTTLKNLMDVWGEESTAYVAKTVGLDIENIQGREAVVGKPMV